MSRLGDSIKKARLAANMTEKQLAKKTGNAENFIKDIENVFSVDLSRKFLTLSQIKKILN